MRLALDAPGAEMAMDSFLRKCVKRGLEVRGCLFGREIIRLRRVRANEIVFLEAPLHQVSLRRDDGIDPADLVADFPGEFEQAIDVGMFHKATLFYTLPEGGAFIYVSVGNDRDWDNLF